MSIKRCWRVAFSILFGGLLAIPLAHAATEPAVKAPPSNAPDQASESQISADLASATVASANQVNPQVVRISYVEGDVRVARGKAAERAFKTDWEVAVAGLPVETGFYLATGAGRAEIEFEDASTVYLAENSVLAFNDLHTTGDLPHTEIALLAGTATLHVNRSGVPSFIVSTPTSRVTAGYHNETYLRLTSYADGLAVAARNNTLTIFPDSPNPVSQSPETGTMYFRGSARVPAPDPGNAPDFSAWDKWVDQRVTERTSAMSAMMKEAGLNAPIPGLADLSGKGTFFKCEPYGTCWEPNESPNEIGGSSGHDLGAAPAHAAALNQDAASPQAKPAATPMPPRKRTLTDLNYFPCGPEQIRYRLNPGAPANQLDYPPMDWALCHAGFWIHQRGHYTWVVHHKIHHHCPVRWVKYGHSVAYVPLHPRDVRGKLPINREHGIFAVSDRKASTVRPVSLNPHQPIRVLNSAPKEFLKPAYAPLAHAAEPQVALHQVLAVKAPSTGIGHAGESHAVLAFNHKSQSFIESRQLTQNGRSVTVREPFGGHAGTLQARAGGFDSHGNFSTHAGGSVGSSGGGTRGGGSSGSGGGSHSSGGSSGGGGGGHSSGGGGGSSSGGGSSGGGSSASGGGSHH